MEKIKTVRMTMPEDSLRGFAEARTTPKPREKETPQRSVFSQVFWAIVCAIVVVYAFSVWF